MAQGAERRNNPEHLSPRAIAERHGLSRGTVYGAVQRGSLEAERLGRRVLIPAYRRWLEDNLKPVKTG